MHVSGTPQIRRRQEEEPAAASAREQLSGAVGSLPPEQQWVKVVYGWGMYSVDYGVFVSTPAEYRCYIGVWPAVSASGHLVTPNQGTNQITHRVVVYGDVWLRSDDPHGGGYRLVPIGPPPTRLPAGLRPAVARRVRWKIR